MLKVLRHVEVISLETDHKVREFLMNDDPNLCLGYRCKSRSAFCNIHEVLEIRRNVQG